MRKYNHAANYASVLCFTQGYNRMCAEKARAESLHLKVSFKNINSVENCLKNLDLMQSRL